MIFHIHIGEQEAEGYFPLQVTAPAGDMYERLTLPQLLLERAAQLLQPGPALPTSDEAALGIFLARQIFTPPIRSLLSRSAAAARQSSSILNLTLQIDSPVLAALPWEWLTIAGRTRWSPALLEDYGLVRVVHAPPVTDQPILSWAAERHFTNRKPLRLLLVTPNSRDDTLHQIAKALATLNPNKHFHSTVSVIDTITDLRQELRQQRPDALHIIAPLDFSAPAKPCLYLSDVAANADECLDAAELAGLLQQNRRMLPPLLVLDGNWAQAGRLTGAASAMALELTRNGVPACITFHSPLYPAESALFAHALYGTLLDGATLEEATAIGRRALNEGGAAAVWGMPMLAARYVGDELPASTRRSSAQGTNASETPSRQRRWPFRAALVGSLITVGLGSMLLASLWQGTQAAPPANVRVESAALLSTPPPVTPALPTPVLFTPVAHSVNELAAPPQRLPPPTALPTPLPPPSGWASYLVAPGDTVSTIALRLGSDPQVIADLNRVALFEPLVVGRALMVPVYWPGEAGVGGLDVNIGRQDRPEVALTFDIEIDDVMLYQYLEILQQRGIRATFFVTGNWVSAYPDAARAIVAAGHELGNHSLSHPSFQRIGAQGAIYELQATEDIVRQTTGASTRPFFRFPYGDKNQALLNLIASQGYISYHWTTDDNALGYWLQGVAAGHTQPNGAIVLLHQRPASVAALPGWLDQLAALGLKPVPLSRVLQ